MLEFTERTTIKMPPPQTARAITQPGYRRRNFAELAQDTFANSAKAFDILDEVVMRCRDRREKEALQVVAVLIAAVKNTAVDMRALVDVLQRTAPPTVPLLPEPPAQPGRMSVPHLQPMPREVRPHKEWWQQ